MLRVACACIGVILLAGCAAPPPIRVLEVPPALPGSLPLPPGATVADRIVQLEDSARRLHAEHAAMEQALLQLDGKIQALRETQQARPSPAPEKPAPTPTPPAPTPLTPLTEKPSARSSPAPVRPERRAERPQTKTAVAASAPAVAPLSGDDLAIEPGASPAPSAAPPVAVSAPVAAATGRAYLVHLASYRSAGQIVPGWRELSRRDRAALAGLSPYTTGFVDTQGRSWVRLSVGPFPTSAEAGRRCADLKQAHIWCDVVGAKANEMKPVGHD